MIEGLSHVMIYAADVEAAVAWYAEMLGFAPSYASPHYASLSHSSAKCRLDIHGASAGNPNIGVGATTWFRVSDIDAAVAALRARGIEVEDPRREGGSAQFAGFADCEGNNLGFVEG